MSKPRPCGTWPSPITAERIAAGSRRLAQPFCHQGAVFWLEGRPEEGGRSALMRWRDGQVECLTPRAYSVRSRAQEYGGGACSPGPGSSLFFVNDADQGIYQQELGDKDPRIDLLVEIEDVRFADLLWDPWRERLIAICEDARDPGAEPRASIVAIDPSGGLDTLAEGEDFYASPRLSPNGRYLAWLSWNHPDMPWDSSRLWVAEFKGNGELAGPIEAAGGGDESICQPEWAPDGSLCFVSDRDDGWWNLYRWDGETSTPMTQEQAEFGLPQWQFGMRSWAFCGDGALLCARTSRGLWHLARLRDGRLQDIAEEWTTIAHLHAADGQAVALAGSPERPASVLRIDPDSGSTEVLAQSTDIELEPALLSRPEPIRFPTGDGEEAYGLFYPPANPKCRVPDGERPPLIVKCHGGPTGATDSALDLRIQFWTSRGFAVVDVNYRGSTGYGRAYRRRLYGGWGEIDVGDCAAAARHLAESGRADPERLLISGSSAGGYTALAALSFTDVFAAGASHYGIGDLEALDRGTHKFESRYTQRLVGPWPESRALWHARSPLRQAERLDCPVIFFQGDEDKVVPPDQAEAMAGALRERGIPVAHVVFKGEGHGFRRAENIRDSLNMELSFYGRVLGFEPADSVPALNIENL
jgi:dipeptidyl aminopeptidase/acylaminoacyl peptidase